MGKVILPKEEGGFRFGYEWHCQAEGCNAAPEGAQPRPARLFIRSKVDRVDAASNFDTKRQVADPLGRWTKQQPGELNWQGLAEERGWKTSPHVVCPACQVGLSPLEYKRKTAPLEPRKQAEVPERKEPESSQTVWQKLFGN